MKKVFPAPFGPARRTRVGLLIAQKTQKSRYAERIFVDILCDIYVHIYIDQDG